MDFSWTCVTITCYFYHFVVESLGSLSLSDVSVLTTWSNFEGSSALSRRLD